MFTRFAVKASDLAETYKNASFQYYLETNPGALHPRIDMRIRRNKENISDEIDAF
jgi:hypothetical protein